MSIQNGRLLSVCHACLSVRQQLNEGTAECTLPLSLTDRHCMRATSTFTVLGDCALRSTRNRGFLIIIIGQLRSWVFQINGEQCYEFTQASPEQRISIGFP